MRLTVDLSAEIDARLSEIAARNGITKAEAMRKAFALLAVADDEKRKNKGFSLGIVRESSSGALTAVGKIIGV